MAPLSAVEGMAGFEPGNLPLCQRVCFLTHPMPRLPDIAKESPADPRLFYPATRSQIRGFIPERTHTCEVASGGDGRPLVTPNGSEAVVVGP